MHVHLLRAADFDPESYDLIVDALKNSNGPLKFYSSDGMIDTQARLIQYTQTIFRYTSIVPAIGEAMDKLGQDELSWNDLFDECLAFRNKNILPRDHVVVLLTNRMNTKRWFSAPSIGKRRDAFVNTNYWTAFPEWDHRYPIVFLIAISLLQLEMFDDWETFLKLSHETPVGCMMDLCVQKSDVLLKLRTADICEDCRAQLKSRSLDGGFVEQVFNIMESTRSQMLFRERFSTTRKPSALKIKGYSKKIYLTDFEDLEVKLTPLEKTVFMVYLNHPEGMTHLEFCECKPEISELYKKLSPSDDPEQIEQSINQLVDIREAASWQEKRSRIKAKFKKLVGEEMVSEYAIEGARGDRKKIKLSRELVQEVE